MMQESENPMKMTIVPQSVLRVAALALGVDRAGCLPVIAQDPSTSTTAAGTGVVHAMGGHGGMRGHQMEFLTKKLNLTPDQVSQVKAIDEDTWKQAKALHEDTSIAGRGQAQRR